MQKNIKKYIYIADASPPRFLENDASALRASASRFRFAPASCNIGLGDIKIINIFNGVPKSKLRKNKILMGINIKLG